MKDNIQYMCSMVWMGVIFNEIPIHVTLQVRIQRPVETPSLPPARDPEADAPSEPAEQDELLDGDTAVEQSEWL